MISVLMPVRNAGPYLSACVQSILDQSYTNWELIAVNDHSADDSAEILKEYALKDSRIKWFNNAGRGIIDGLRMAYAKSQGNILTRMDADDLMSADKLDCMHGLLKQVGQGHLVTAYVEYFSANELGEGYQKYAEWLNQLSEQGNNFQEIYKECVIPSPCWMVFKADFERSGAFISDRYPEDYDLCFRFRDAGLQVRAVKKVIHYWRDHSDRASRNDPNYLDNRFIELKMYHFLKSDYDTTSGLVLWGAGKKAKSIALQLKAKDVSFRWICNNPNKIGKDIYGVVLESDQVISQIQNAQFIVAVANPLEQKDIKEALKHHEPEWLFFFC